MKEMPSEYKGSYLENQEKRFLVTPIGCGIAGFTPGEIAPLFHGAVNWENVSLPESFWKVLKEGYRR
ncbi:MAG: hypothetical protein IJ205_05650 [Bacteroidales bacterium]|nr:hypothetical protein [Bacteroidales bacterium]